MWPQKVVIVLLVIPLTYSLRRYPHADTSQTPTNLRPKPQSTHKPQSTPRKLSIPNYSSFEVTTLRGLNPDDFPTKHYAGHTSITPNDYSPDSKEQLFSWLFHPADNNGEPVEVEEGKKRLIIWLNGGPACSSMDGLWLGEG